jgi:uncharacterized membrane protein
MGRYLLIGFILVFAFLGIANSWYLAESSLTGKPLICNIAGLGDCNKVAESEYSHVLGVPLSLYGVAFYTLLFVFSALLILIRTRPVYLSLMTFATLGFLASLYFMGLQLFVIKSICVYCLTSAILSALIFALALYLWKHFPRGALTPSTKTP